MTFQRDSIQYPLILLPKEDGFGLICWDGSLWKEKALLYNPLQPYISKNEIAFCQPSIQLMDFNQDGEKDVLIIGKDLRVYLMNQPESLPDTSVILPHYHYDLELSRMPLSSMETLLPVQHLPMIFELNGDNAADLLISQAPRGGWTHAISHVQIYKNQFGHLASMPDQVVKGENLTGTIYVEDLNLDGFKDLIVERQALDIWQAARFLFSQKIKIGFDIYLMSEKKNYPDSPDYKLEFSQRATSDWMNFTCKANFSGDWNGDGLKDLFIESKPGSFAIVPGTRDGFDEESKLYIPNISTQNISFNTQSLHPTMFAAWNVWPENQWHKLALIIADYE